MATLLRLPWPQRCCALHFRIKGRCALGTHSSTALNKQGGKIDDKGGCAPIPLHSLGSWKKKVTRIFNLLLVRAEYSPHRICSICQKIDEPASRSLPEGHGQSYLHPISLKSHNSGEGQMQAHLTVTGELVSLPEQASEKVNIHHLSIFNIY